MILELRPQDTEGDGRVKNQVCAENGGCITMIKNVGGGYYAN